LSKGVSCGINADVKQTKQLQYIHIEQVAEMLSYNLLCSYLFVQRVCGQKFTI